MFYVLKHKQTSQIATDTLINTYNIPYYGAKFWHDEASARAEMADYLAEKGMTDHDMWEVILVEEMEMKMFNVKLKNNPSMRLYVDEQGKSYVQEAHTT